MVGSAKTLPMIRQFFPLEIDGRFQAVKEGDTLSLGRHQLSLCHGAAGALAGGHDDLRRRRTRVLFSADAFGTFGALDGNLFADEVDFQRDWLDDARRYYTNIVGKYGTPVQNVLQKAAGLDIQYLCPLHGPVWRANIGWFLEKYQRWSTYTPEEAGAADLLRLRLRPHGKRLRDFGVPAGGARRQECADFRRLPYRRIGAGQRRVPVQPSGVCQRHLQRRHLHPHGNPAAGTEGSRPAKPLGGAD